MSSNEEAWFMMMGRLLTHEACLNWPRKKKRSGSSARQVQRPNFSEHVCVSVYMTWDYWPREPVASFSEQKKDCADGHQPSSSPPRVWPKLGPVCTGSYVIYDILQGRTFCQLFPALLMLMRSSERFRGRNWKKRIVCTCGTGAVCIWNSDFSKSERLLSWMWENIRIFVWFELWLYMWKMEIIIFLDFNQLHKLW